MRSLPPLVAWNGSTFITFDVFAARRVIRAFSLVGLVGGLDGWLYHGGTHDAKRATNETKLIGYQ